MKNYLFIGIWMFNLLYESLSQKNFQYVREKYEPSQSFQEISPFKYSNMNYPDQASDPKFWYQSEKKISPIKINDPEENLSDIFDNFSKLNTNNQNFQSLEKSQLKNFANINERPDKIFSQQKYVPNASDDVKNVGREFLINPNRFESEDYTAANRKENEINIPNEYKIDYTPIKEMSYGSPIQLYPFENLNPKNRFCSADYSRINPRNTLFFSIAKIQFLSNFLGKLNVVDVHPGSWIQS